METVVTAPDDRTQEPAPEPPEPIPPAPADYPEQLLSAALSYARVKLPVFPIFPPGPFKGWCSCKDGARCDNAAKHPIGLPSMAPKGHNSATTDEFTIKRWWKQTPNANIGIKVPEGYVVLDVDGLEGYEAISDEFGESAIPATMSAQTARGFHHWFTTTSEVRPGSDFLPHVDMRGPGGYVVAPPSMHRSGLLYEWEHDHAPNKLRPVAAPTWLYELVRRSRLGLEGQEHGPRVDVAGTLQGVGEGERHDRLFKLASSFVRSRLPYEHALREILYAADNCVPPMPHDEAKRDVDWAYNRYQVTDLADGAGRVTLIEKDRIEVVLNSSTGPITFLFDEMEKTNAREMNAEMSVRRLQPGTSPDAFTTRLNLLSASARDVVRREMEQVLELEKPGSGKLLNRAVDQARSAFLNQDRMVRVREINAPERLEYVVERLLLQDRPTILFGPGGSLKTYVLMSLMLAIARGEDWLGRKVQKRNCALLDYESGQGTTAMRFRHLARAVGLDDVPENIFIWPADGMPLEDLVPSLRRNFATHEIGFLGIDHCAAAAGTKPEESDAALRFYRGVEKLHLPTVALAHVTGDVASNPELGKRPFGSIFWDNGAGLTWFMRKEEQDEDSPLATIGFFQRKWNDTGRLRDFSLTFTFELDRGSYSQISVERADLRDSPALQRTRTARQQIHDVLTRPLTIEQIAELTGLSLATVRKNLNEGRGKIFENVTASAGGHANRWQRVDFLNCATVPPLKELGVQYGSGAFSPPELPYPGTDGGTVGGTVLSRDETGDETGNRTRVQIEPYPGTDRKTEDFPGGTVQRNGHRDSGDPDWGGTDAEWADLQAADPSPDKGELPF